DQHLEPVARARREPMRSDELRTRIQGGLPADPSQAAAMMSSSRALDGVPEGRVDTSERARETRRCTNGRGDAATHAEDGMSVSFPRSPLRKPRRMDRSARQA